MSQLVLMTYEKGVGVYDEVDGKASVKWIESNRIEALTLEELKQHRGFSFLTKSSDSLVVEVEELSTAALRERLSALTRVKDTTAKKATYAVKKRKEKELGDAIKRAMDILKERGLTNED